MKASGFVLDDFSEQGEELLQTIFMVMSGGSSGGGGDTSWGSQIELLGVISMQVEIATTNIEKK